MTGPGQGGADFADGVKEIRDSGHPLNTTFAGRRGHRSSTPTRIASSTAPVAGTSATTLHNASMPTFMNSLYQHGRTGLVAVVTAIKDQNHEYEQTAHRTMHADPFGLLAFKFLLKAGKAIKAVVDFAKVAKKLLAPKVAPVSRKIITKICDYPNIAALAQTAAMLPIAYIAKIDVPIPIINDIPFSSMFNILTDSTSTNAITFLTLFGLNRFFNKTALKDAGTADNIERLNAGVDMQVSTGRKIATGIGLGLFVAGAYFLPDEVRGYALHASDLAQSSSYMSPEYFQALGYTAITSTLTWTSLKGLTAFVFRVPNEVRGKSRP